MPADERDVLELARWIHDTQRDERLERDILPLPKYWDELRECERGLYLAVARALLEQPPDVVRRAVRRLELTD